jgi:UDP-glucuronate 4-epimerase
MGTILVTGGAGFIGSHLTKKLLAEGYNVVCVDNFTYTYDPFVKWDHINAFRNHPQYHLLSIDIREKEALQQVMEDYQVEAVIHLAALAGVRPSIQNPAAYVDVNIGGTLSVLESMRYAGINKLVFASSSSVYGDATQAPFQETAEVNHPVSPYALTKRTGEMLCENYYQLHGIETYCLRLFTVYGPGQRPEMAISYFLRNILAGTSMDVFGDGTSARDYTYVEDVVAGILASLKTVRGFEIFNLGSSGTISLNELIGTLEAVTERTALVNRLSDQPGDVRLTHADISKARAMLGYQPATSLHQGLHNMVEALNHSSMNALPA